MTHPIKPISLAMLCGMITMANPALADTIQLRIIETTDIHTNLMDYDYYKDKPSNQIGLTRAATLIQRARHEVKNSVLVDNGDLLQGSPMGDYMAAKGIKPGDVHPAFKAMNLLAYDVATIGNHEFNYGLTFLNESINDANFPYINANVVDAKTGKPFFTPYLIKNQTFISTDGKTRQLKVGYIGFVPPQVMVWDKKNLSGKVRVNDITQTAKKLIPEMKKQGADIIIALSHSGISGDPYQSGAENSAVYLTKINGINAVASGHAHAVFPGQEFATLDNADIHNGTINGVATVMPGRWASHIGVMDLTLEEQNGQWVVTHSHGESRPIFDKAHHQSLAAPDPAMVKALANDHKATRAFVNQPIGTANDVMYSYLALVQDDPTIQIVNMAQADYVKHFIQGNPDLEHLPVLSAAAPFKAGGRKNDPTNYTEVESGDLSFRNAADLYLYPNTLATLKVSAKQLKEWLECSAGQFRQIDPTNTQPQSLIDWDSFRTYNFDVIDGVNYQIDVTQPAKYDGDCQMIHPQAQRIVNLTYQGKPLDPNQQFLVASNNYRAYGNKFAGTGAQYVAFDAPDENRTILANYITRISQARGAVTPSADNNWSFAPIHADTKLNIQFETAPGKKAAEFIKTHGQYPMTYIGKDEVGFAVYRIDLQK